MDSAFTQATNDFRSRKFAESCGGKAALAFFAFLVRYIRRIVEAHVHVGEFKVILDEILYLMLLA